MPNTGVQITHQPPLSGVEGESGLQRGHSDAKMALGAEVRGPDTSGDRHQRGRSESQTEEVACAKAQVTEPREGRRWGHCQ